MKTMPRLLVQLTALLLAPCLVVAADPFPGIGGPVGSSGHGPRVTDNVFSSQAIPPPGVNELAPIVPGDLSNEVHALDRDHLLPGNRAAPARPTILIAEDQPDTYTFLTEMLTEVGYEVMAAMDGEAALALFESVPPGTISAVITDGIMPKMSGGQLVEKLYSKQQDLLIILTTDLEGITEAIVQEYPQIAVIPKPYTINTILSVFAKRLQQSTSSAGAGEQVPSAGMLMDAFFAGLEGPQALQLRKSVGEKSLFRDSALQAGAAESALNALRQLQHFYSQSLDREVVKSQQAVMALAKKADDMIAAIPDLPVQQMIDDLATDLFAVERLDAAEWPSRQEGIRDGFQALGEKLHVMIRGLEHWPAGRALPTILRGGVYAVDSETLYRYGLTINEPPAGPVGGGPAIEGRQKRGRGRVIETMNAAVLAGMLLEQFIENRQSVIARTFDPSRGAMHYGGKKGPPKPPDSDKPTTPAPPRMRHRHGSSHESAPAPQRSVLDDLQEGLSRLLDLGPQESLAHLIRSIIQALESLRDLSKPETTTGAPASDDSPMPIQTAPARRIVNKFVQLAEAAILPVAMETLRALGRLISQNALIHELDAVFRALPPDVIQKDFSLFEATSHRVEIDMLGAFIQLFNTLQAGFDQVIYFELGTLLGDRLNALGTMVRARANVPGRVRKTTVRNLLWPMMMDCLHAIICGGPDRDRLPTQRDAAAWLSWFESDAFLDEAARILRAHPLTSRIARRAA